MTPSHAAAFALFSFFLSLHACNCRILFAKDFDQGQALGPEAVTECMSSKLQDSESVSSTNTSRPMTAKHPILLQHERCADAGSHHQCTKTAGIPKIEERRLEDKTFAAQEVEVDANNPENDVAEDAVVMDYAHPHRKPPIHNEEN